MAVAESDFVRDTSRGVTWANATALLVSVAGSAGSVYLSIGLGLKACPLCFYQRSFVMAAALVVIVNLALEGLRSARACLLALPMAVAGLAVALFHKYLVWTGKLECPAGLWGLGDGPAQSVVIFLLLFVACLAAVPAAIRQWGRQAGTTAAAGLVLGLVAAWAAVASAPPLPAAPSQPYDPVKQPLDGCRPPFVQRADA
ncbi:MAG: hypothetical protein KatS3mg110_2461 [Pirellulaceae bacterium]|nr:MAG: hypothetical protein KatS3mg110_2461 [Pirellulaceae bacterium]